MNILARRVQIVVTCVLTAACGSKSTAGGGPPTTPSPTVTVARLTAPTPDSPANQFQLNTLRPTLTVTNGTSDQPQGTRTYEFQISDRADFTSLAAGSSLSVKSGISFLVVATKTGVAEGSGQTTFTPDEDLQPTTRFYWRARLTQGTATSEWSEVRSFKTKLVGFNRPGELYDPLIHGETVGARIGSTTFVNGKGIRVNDGNSYVRYVLAQTITNGEFSADVTGLYGNSPGGKKRVFSMMDGGDNLCKSKFLFNVQYRGIPGNPDNAFSYKALFGDEDFKNEPNKTIRTASVRMLDPSRTYHWKATWSAGINVVVQEDRRGGNSIFEHGTTTGGIYNPTPHVAYLGANNGGKCEEEGSFPGLTFSNVWIGNRPRPESLGSALEAP